MNQPTKRPAWYHLASEGRSLFELGLTGAFLPFLLRAPKGDKHPVLVLPGFLASDASTKPLRSFLKVKGYQSHGWGLGRNLGKDIRKGERLISDRLLNRLLDIYSSHQQPVSLIGWSLGGILAREMAREAPELVRQVITLGSPFASPAGAAPMAAKLFKMINGDHERQHRQSLNRLIEPPPVPSSAIFSRSDGIAHWRACKEVSLLGNAENIEVLGSHLGLGHNPQVLWIIADRLAQPLDNWQPFRKGKAYNALFPNPERP